MKKYKIVNDLSVGILFLLAGSQVSINYFEIPQVYSELIICGIFGSTLTYGVFYLISGLVDMFYKKS